MAHVGELRNTMSHTMTVRAIFSTSFTLAIVLCSCSSSEAKLIASGAVDCVVAIGRTDTTPGPNQGRWVAEASGFLFGERIGPKNDDNTKDAYILYLVTNTHVIEDHVANTKDPLSVKFNLMSSNSAREYPIDLIDAQGKPTWFANPAVDVAVIRLNGQFLKNEGARFNFFKHEDLLLHAEAKDLGLSEGDGVFVLGFPMGLIGQNEDYVIVRKGTVARVRDALDSSNADSSFLIDSFIFPGNSGGPVILRPELVTVQGEKPPIMRSYVIGIVRAYIPYTDLAISPQTHHVRVSFEENSGLAEVIPPDAIEETIRDFEKAVPLTL